VQKELILLMKATIMQLKRRIMKIRPNKKIK